VDNLFMVQLQCDNGGAPARRETHDARAVLAPSKVFRPSLGSRVEETDAPTGLRVAGMRLRSLEFIARVAGQAQIILACEPAYGLRPNVVNDHPRPADSLRRPAITTSKS
jgi:hypothetical protein